MPYFLAAVASGVDSSAFVRTVAILSAAPVAGIGGFCWLLLVAVNMVNGNRVFLCSASYKKRVLRRIFLTLNKLHRSGQVEILLLQQLLSKGLGGTLFNNLVSDHFLL